MKASRIFLGLLGMLLILMIGGLSPWTSTSTSDDWEEGSSSMAEAAERLPAGKPTAQIQPEITGLVRLNRLDSEARSWAHLEKRMRWDAEGLVVERHADGHEFVHLDGRFTHVSAAIPRSGTSDKEWVIPCYAHFHAMDGHLCGSSPVPPTVPIIHETAAY